MPEITWWGHATTTIVESGVSLLTDPVLTSRVAHLRRLRGPVPAPRARSADRVLISHLHADHLHVRSLARLDPRVPLVVPAGARDLVPGLRRLRARTFHEVTPGDEVAVGPVRVHVVPAAHDGRRHAAASSSVIPVGYVVSGSVRTYFAGDTDLFDDMAASVWPCDVALLPVGGWGPGLGPGHLDPVRAAQAAGVLGAAHLIPIHYGTLWPIGLSRVGRQQFAAPGHEFERHAAHHAPRARVHRLEPGQSVTLAR